MILHLQYLLGLLAVIPVAAYIFFLSRYSLDIPYWDDYDAILNSLLLIHGEKNIIHAIGPLFAQHVQHRIVITRLIAWGDWKLFCEISFQRLIWVGNAFLFGVAFLLRRSLASKNKGVIFAAVCFFIFHFAGWESSLWAMAALSNYGVLFFGLATLFLVEQRKPVLALVCGLLTTWSQGNGLLIWPLMIWMAFLLDQKRLAMASVAFMLACTIIYFWDYRNPTQLVSPLHNLQMPLHILDYSVLMAGNLIPQKNLARILGSFNLLIVVFLCLRPRDKLHLKSFQVFLVMSIVLAAISRLQFGSSNAFSSRYTVYTSLLFVGNMAVLLDKPGYRASMMLILAIPFWLLSNMHALPQAEARYKSLRAGLERLAMGDSGDSTVLSYPIPGAALDTLKRSYTAKLYNVLPVIIAQQHLSLEGVSLHKPTNLSRLENSPPTKVEIYLGTPGKFAGEAAGHLGGGVEQIEVLHNVMLVSGHTDMALHEAGQALIVLLPRVLPLHHLLTMEETSGINTSSFRLLLIFAQPKEAIHASRNVCLGFRSINTATTLLYNQNPACNSLAQAR